MEKEFATKDKQQGFAFAKRWMQPRSFDRLTRATAEDKNTAAFLAFFLDEIGPAVVSNQHTAPQWQLLQINGLSHEDLTEIRNYKDNTAVLTSEFAIVAEIRNVTRTTGPDPLDSDELTAFCRVSYARDYSMFGDHF